MENPGEYLKERREELRISIGELSSQTRIPIRFIEAIEADQFDLLPNPVSAKGFLRSYAECVGVDPSVVTDDLTQYRPQIDPVVHPENQDELLSYLHVKKTGQVPFPRRIVLSVGGLIALLLVLVGLLSNNSKNMGIYSSSPLSSENPLQGPESPVLPASPLFSEEAEAPEQTALTGQDSGATEKESPPEPPPSPERPGQAEEKEENVTPALPENLPPAEPQPPQAAEAGLKPKAHILFLEATEASWVQVTIDDSDVREALLQPKDTVQWEAEKKFLLTLGNAGGVRVELDGQDLGPLGESGEVVHKEIRGGAN